MWGIYTNYNSSSPHIQLIYNGTQLGSFYYDVTISYSYNADVAILEDGSTYLGTTQINGDLLPHNTCSIGKLNNPWNTLYIKNINISGGVLTDFLPDKSNTRTLGNSSYKWKEIYSNAPTINTSDFNAKESIVQLTEKYQAFFDALEPVSYKFKINSSNRTHVGYIGQKVKQSLLEANLTTLDFAGYCEWEKEDKTIECGLRYSEFIALNTWQIQKLKPRMTTAEEKIQQLELGVAELKQELATLKNQ